jgi:D-glycero-alpha-D-manno-heptose-7-phosphate kinase
VRYHARAPLRIDFGGGWTDVPLYSEREGGAVLNAAITRYVTGSIARPGLTGLLGALRGHRSSVEYRLDLPSGAGLGASAAQTVLWVTLVKTTIANTSSRAEIAEIAWQIGGLLGILGGKQDEYACALGGMNLLTFTDSVQVERLKLASSTEYELESRLVLIDSGERRNSGALHAAVWDRYRSGDARVAHALGRMKELAHAMRHDLDTGNLTMLGEHLNEHWSEQKALDPSVTTPHLDALFEFAMRHGAIGGKACGAGGGGCLLFLAGHGESENLRAAFHRRGVSQIEFSFDTYGVFLKKA